MHLVDPGVTKEDGMSGRIPLGHRIFPGRGIEISVHTVRTPGSVFPYNLRPGPEFPLYRPEYAKLITITIMASHGKNLRKRVKNDRICTKLSSTAYYYRIFKFLGPSNEQIFEEKKLQTSKID